MKNIKIVLVFTLIFIGAYETSYSQWVSSEIWIKVKDYFPAGGQDTVTNWFGNHINARFYPLDTLEDMTIFGGCNRIHEVSSPPLPPGFATVWRNIKNRSTNPYGIGLVRYDFRGVPTNPSKIDTFHLFFQNQYSQDSADFVFKWPSASYLSQRCDSMWLSYNDLNADPVTQWVNMFTVDSLVIPLATLNGISDLWIY